MANIGALLKQEIQRLARKEVRGQVGPLRRLTIQYRQVIADLRRRLADLERVQARAQRVASARVASGEPEAAPGAAKKRVARARFSAEGLRAEPHKTDEEHGVHGSGRFRRVFRLGSTGPGLEIDAAALGRLRLRRVG